MAYPEMRAEISNIAHKYALYERNRCADELMKYISDQLNDEIDSEADIVKHANQYHAEGMYHAARIVRELLLGSSK